MPVTRAAPFNFCSFSTQFHNFLLFYMEWVDDGLALGYFGFSLSPSLPFPSAPFPSLPFRDLFGLLFCRTLPACTSVWLGIKAGV